MAAARRPRHYYVARQQNPAADMDALERDAFPGCQHTWPPGRWGSDARCERPVDDPIHFQRARRPQDRARAA